MCICIGTWPCSPSTILTMSTVFSRMGMKSVMRTEPSGVSNSVSRTSVPSRYRRRVARPPAAGAMSHRPLFSSPSRAAKHAPLSKRGAHIQSTEPSSPMSAAVWVSPIMAYCSMREDTAEGRYPFPSPTSWSPDSARRLISTKARRSCANASRSGSWCRPSRPSKPSTSAATPSMASRASSRSGSVPSSADRCSSASSHSPMAWLATMSATGVCASCSRSARSCSRAASSSGPPASPGGAALSGSSGSFSPPGVQSVLTLISLPLHIRAGSEQLGVKPLPEALTIAREEELDLVEVAPNANPPVCRIMNYGRYKYEQEQRRKESRKKATNVVVKEMKFRPKIDEHDYVTKMKHVERFLAEGSKVKLTIMFRGREVFHPELGLRILERVAEQVNEIAIVESAPRQDGRNMTMVLHPIKRPAKARAAAAPPPPTGNGSEGEQ